MPEKTLVDPYVFVPLGGALLGDTPQRRVPVGHDRFAGHSGRLECTLTAKTPLFVYDPRFVKSESQGHQQVTFPVFDGSAVIPGTSLKGALRSLTEAVEACCFTLPLEWPADYRGGGITKGKSLTARLPDERFAHCTSKEELCPACRLFGTLKGRRLFGTLKGEMAYAGKVMISDARATAGEYKLGGYLTLDVLSAPKPEGRPKAYVKDGGTIRGRKFYRHSTEPVRLREGGRRDRQNKTVQPVESGAVFHFVVEYNDLAEDELRLLLYTLTLEPGLWHKVGMGKPIGLGSVQIEVTSWTKIARDERYRALGGGISQSLIGEALATELAAWTQPYQASQAANLKALREVLRPNPNLEVRYQVQRPGPRPRR